jgi:hypothetical protein
MDANATSGTKEAEAADEIPAVTATASCSATAINHAPVGQRMGQGLRQDCASETLTLTTKSEPFQTDSDTESDTDTDSGSSSSGGSEIGEEEVETETEIGIDGAQTQSLLPTEEEAVAALGTVSLTG